MATTKRKFCFCKSPFQDRTYGPGKRVHNKTGRRGSTQGWKCTVCGDTKKD